MNSIAKHAILVAIILCIGCSHHGRTVPAASQASPTLRSPRTAFEYFGLRDTLSLEEVIALEKRCKNESEFTGQGCGAIVGPNRELTGFYFNSYYRDIPGVGATFIKFGHIQNEEISRALFTFSLNDNLSYHRQGDIFVLYKPPEKALGS